MASYNPARNVTDDAANIYDARDVPRATPQHLTNLYYALRAQIAHFTVEFLYTNEVKPHVVFKVNFASPIGPRDEINSARVSMELVEGAMYGGQGPGACRIKLCDYLGRTARASASFQFSLWRSITLADMIHLINGVYPELPNTMRTDMKYFDFVDIDNSFDGCRDWIAQVFVRAHAVGVVDWAIKGILGPDGQELQRENLQPSRRLQVTLINWHRAGFHHVIGKFYELPVSVSSATPLVVYHDLLVERGHFWAVDFVRFTTDFQHGYRLPYRVHQANTGASGNTARGRGGAAARPSGAERGAATSAPTGGRGGAAAGPSGVGRGAATSAPTGGRGGAAALTGRGDISGRRGR